jgi:hypothetical protein
LSYLNTLLDRFDCDEGNSLKRAIDVLDMIEFSITYPACDTITKEGIKDIDSRVKKIQTELKEDPVLARKIGRWWYKRETCRNIAKDANTKGFDHISSLQYHERIMSIRKARIALIKRLKGEELPLKEHGLFGSKYPHTIVHN